MTLTISNYEFASKLIKVKFSSPASESNSPFHIPPYNCCLLSWLLWNKTVSQKLLQVAKPFLHRKHFYFLKSPLDLSGIFVKIDKVTISKTSKLICLQKPYLETWFLGCEITNRSAVDCGARSFQGEMGEKKIIWNDRIFYLPI